MGFPCSTSKELANGLTLFLQMDVHAHKYLKTVADRDHPDELLYLPACLLMVHTSRVLAARA